MIGAGWRAPTVHADGATQCPYPGVGILQVNILGIGGGFCDMPTEINGSHWHCQAGGINVGGVFGGASGPLSVGGNPAGIGGLSCNWRCPDGTDAPAPNPPGAWVRFLVPMDTTNFCRDHMGPNGFWTNPVLSTEGLPPAGEQQPVVVPQPVPAPVPWLPPPPPPPPGPPLPPPPPSMWPPWDQPGPPPPEEEPSPIGPGALPGPIAPGVP
jgi:hypothetical protein